MLYSLHDGVALLHNHRVGSPFQSLGHTSTGRIVHSTIPVGCASALEIPLASVCVCVWGDPSRL